MTELTQSLRHWLWENHREIIAPMMFGHIELFTDEMQEQYLEWCETADGKQYLEGGAE